MSPRVAQLPPPRRLRSLVVGGTRAAFGIGAGYEPQKVSAQAVFDDSAVSGYFVDLRAKTLRDPKAFVSGRGRAYGISATTRAQRALGWWDRHVAGDAGAGDAFVREAKELRDLAERADLGLLWRYDVDVPKYGCRAPWHSCMAQGQAASVLVRAWLTTGDDSWAADACAAVQPLLRDTGIGVVRETSSGPVLEECPSEPPSSILNGWIFALWGLWDVAVALRDRDASGGFARGVEVLTKHLHNYDLGWWSRYSVYPGQPDLATPFYHRVHISQVDVMYRLTGREVFAETRARWRSYDRPRARARAITTKVGPAFSDVCRRSREPA